VSPLGNAAPDVDGGIIDRPDLVNALFHEIYSGPGSCRLTEEFFARHAIDVAISR
jgi:hypothetical protein